MIKAKTGFRGFQFYNVWARNYVAMSFYLIDAHEAGLDFSFVGCAADDGVSYADLMYDEGNIAGYLERGASYDTLRDIDYKAATCPICGGKLTTKADINSYMPVNRLYCETPRCDDILDYFKRDEFNNKADYARKLRKLASIARTTQKEFKLYFVDYEFNELMSLAMISVFTQENKSNPLAIKSNLIDLRKAAEQAGVNTGNIFKASNTGRLYGVSFPKRVSQDKGLISKKGLEEWLSNDIVQKKLAEKRATKINH